MTHIPLDPLTHSLASESRTAPSDARVSALEEDSRFDAHLRRAERKPEPSERKSRPEAPDAETRPDAQTDSPPAAEEAADSGGDGEIATEQADLRETGAEQDAAEAEESAEEARITAAVCVCETVVSMSEPVLGIESTGAATGVETAVAAQATAQPAGLKEASPSGAAILPAETTEGETGGLPRNAGPVEASDHRSTTPVNLENTTVDTTAPQSQSGDTPLDQADAGVLQSTAVTQTKPAESGSPAEDSAETPKLPDAEAPLEQAAPIPQATSLDRQDSLDSGNGRREREARGPATDGSGTTAPVDPPVPAADGPDMTAAVPSTGDGTEAAERSAGKAESFTPAVHTVTETTPQRSGAQVNAEIPSESTPRAGEADSADAARFIRRVAGAFEAAGRRGEPIRIQLTPPEMGTLRLEITMERGEITARLETDTQDARNLLLDNLPHLRERLEQQNIKINRFDVEYNAGSDGSGPAPEDWTRQQQNRHPASQERPDRPPETETPARAPRLAEATPDGRINLFA